MKSMLLRSLKWSARWKRTEIKKGKENFLMIYQKVELSWLGWVSRMNESVPSRMNNDEPKLFKQQSFIKKKRGEKTLII